MSPEKKKTIMDHLFGNNIVPIVVAFVAAFGNYVVMKYQVDSDNRAKGIVTPEQVREISEHEAKEEVAVIAERVNGLTRMMEEYGKNQERINMRLSRVLRNMGKTVEAESVDTIMAEQRRITEKEK